ncbi:MFS transporter [uncultured Enterovirga sp.]|uniref:MFS transporter n=1 Tax=uncultured Enterovirga sp. TaxID=2026352 RepID=UPI0035CB7922
MNGGPTDTHRTAWPAVFACFCLAVFAWTFGFYGQAVFLAELQRQNGWSASLVSSATTTYYLVGAVALAFVPEAIERFGRRPAILAGMAALAGGAALLPAVASVPALYGAHLLMAAGWALTSGIAITASLAPWFGRRRGLAISLALNGASAAGFTTVPLLIQLTVTFGFADGLWLMATILLALAVPVILFGLREPGAAWLARERDGGAAGSAEAAELAAARPAPASRAEALRDRRFWLAAMPFALGLVAQVGFIVHQVALLPRLGPEGTGFAVALTTIAALVGRIAVSVVIDRLDRRAVTAASFAVQAASLGALLLVPSDPVAYVACFTFGLSVGNAITLPALVVLDEYAPASFGLVVGLVTATNQFLYAFGPVLLGLLHDATGGYTFPLLACMALELAAAALAVAGRPKPTR